MLLKLGLARLDDGDFTHAADILASRVVTAEGVIPAARQRLPGMLDKNQPEILIYNTLLGTQGSYYASVGQSLLFSNNLGARPGWPGGAKPTPKLCLCISLSA